MQCEGRARPDALPHPAHSSPRCRLSCCPGGGGHWASPLRAGGGGAWAGFHPALQQAMGPGRRPQPDAREGQRGPGYSHSSWPPCQVRRAALRYLLHCEHLQHLRELNRGGSPSTWRGCEHPALGSSNLPTPAPHSAKLRPTVAQGSMGPQALHLTALAHPAPEPPSRWDSRGCCYFRDSDKTSRED